VAGETGEGASADVVDGAAPEPLFQRAFADVQPIPPEHLLGAQFPQSGRLGKSVALPDLLGYSDADSLEFADSIAASKFFMFVSSSFGSFDPIG